MVTQAVNYVPFGIEQLSLKSPFRDSETFASSRLSHINETYTVPSRSSVNKVQRVASAGRLRPNLSMKALFHEDSVVPANHVQVTEMSSLPGEIYGSFVDSNRSANTVNSLTRHKSRLLKQVTKAVQHPATLESTDYTGSDSKSLSHI